MSGLELVVVLLMAQGAAADPGVDRRADRRRSRLRVRGGPPRRARPPAQAERARRRGDPRRCAPACAGWRRVRWSPSSTATSRAEPADARRPSQPRRAGAAPPAMPVIVGIAASAGGPTALATVLGALSADLPICLAIVQHLPRGFAPSFVSFLQARCSLAVRLAEPGLVPRAGTVVLAPDDHHLELIDGQFALTSGPPVEGHRPSGTVLLRSLAHARQRRRSAWCSAGSAATAPTACARCAIATRSRSPRTRRARWSTACRARRSRTARRSRCCRSAQIGDAIAAAVIWPRRWRRA